MAAAPPWHMKPDRIQMRRAVREYKYEVNENKLQEEFVQYLAQIQKDWERQRVKLGVEALRKEVRACFYACQVLRANLP
jgi:hypothetical protein